MLIASSEANTVIGGIDTHQDEHWAAVVDQTGRVLGTQAFSTTAAGYRAILTWFGSKGGVDRVGVESTGSYGAGITRHLALAGIPVLEVTRPDLAARRRQGKDDQIAAVAAAHAALWGQRVQVPRTVTARSKRCAPFEQRVAMRSRRVVPRCSCYTTPSWPHSTKSAIGSAT